MLDPVVLCSAWKLSPVRSSWRAETGTVHQTRLLELSDGSRYALRAYRYTAEERERIVQEHSLSAFMSERGLLALAPIPLPSGETILERDGHFYALFPFAEGAQVPRGQLAAHEIEATGSFLGKLHLALRDYPHEPITWRGWTIDRASVFTRLDKIEQALRALNRPGEDDLAALSRLVQRRAWLLSARQVDLAAIRRLEIQLIHGDYQETNLFFVDGQVSAIIDWDQTYLAPRSWEVLRTLHYAGKLEPSFCRAFLRAYRQVQPLTQAELDIAAEVYGWMQAHNLWVEEELYVRGNERVRVLLEPHDRFVSFAERWVALRTEILHDPGQRSERCDCAG